MIEKIKVGYGSTEAMLAWRITPVSMPRECFPELHNGCCPADPVVARIEFGRYNPDNEAETPDGNSRVVSRMNSGAPSNRTGDPPQGTYSVIIPAYNAASTLPECLESIYGQSCLERLVEVIVVDDASTDDTAEIALAYGCRVINSPVRQGPASARNRGAAEACSERLLFVDADIVLPEDALAGFDECFRARPDVSTFVAARSPQTRYKNIASRYKNYWTAYNWSMQRHAQALNGSAFAISRTEFILSGGFDEQIQDAFYEDDELGHRIADRGGRIGVAHDIRVMHIKKLTLGSLLVRDMNPGYAQYMMKRRRSGFFRLRYSSVTKSFLVSFPLLTLALLAGVLAGVVPGHPRPLLLMCAGLIVVVAGINFRFWAFIRDNEGASWPLLQFIPLFLLHVFCTGMAQIAGFIKALFAPGQ